MKRLILIMCVAVFGFTFQAKAQWAVLDPSNLVQNIQQVVKSSSTVSNLVSNVKYKVEAFTGMEIDKIDIYVEGVRAID